MTILAGIRLTILEVTLGLFEGLATIRHPQAPAPAPIWTVWLVLGQPPLHILTLQRFLFPLNMVHGAIVRLLLFYRTNRAQGADFGDRECPSNLIVCPGSAWQLTMPTVHRDVTPCVTRWETGVCSVRLQARRTLGRNCGIRSTLANNLVVASVKLK